MSMLRALRRAPSLSALRWPFAALVALTFSAPAWASSASAPASSAGTVLMLTNLVKAISAYWMVFHNFALVIGMTLVVSSLYAFTKNSREGGGMKMAIMGFVAGIFLISIDATISAFSWTILDSAPDKAMSYTPASGGANAYGLTVQFAVYVVQLVGFYGLIKGMYLLRESGQDRSKFPVAIVHMIGGILSINAVTLLNTAASSIGGTFQQVITQILNG